MHDIFIRILSLYMLFLHYLLDRQSNHCVNKWTRQRNLEEIQKDSQMGAQRCDKTRNDSN